MSLKIESFIQKILKENDSFFVADELMKLWESENLSVEDRNSIVHFLIHSGFLTTLKNKCLEALSNNKSINWKALLYFLSTTKLDSQKQDSIFIGLTETNELNSLLHFEKFNQYPKFQKIYLSKVGELQLKLKKELDILKDKFKQALNDKNDNELRKLSEILVSKFSFDPEVTLLTGDLDLHKAKKILKKIETTEIDSILRKYSQNFSDDPLVVEALLKSAEVNKESAYEIAVSLYQLEKYKESLTCLELAPETQSKDWMKLDLLCKNKKWIELLDYSYLLEKKYALEPDTLPEVLYYRALTFYELNDKEKAIGILEKISESVPSHWKSKLQLREWKELS